jgi:hypothetical protein
MATARSARRLRSAESANSRSTALRDVPRRVASASTSPRRSSGIDTMTFAIPKVYRGIRQEPSPAWWPGTEVAVAAEVQTPGGTSTQQLHERPLLSGQ